MSCIKIGDEVKYVRTPNRRAYKPDSVKGTILKVNSILQDNGRKCYQIEFENNVKATTYKEDLELTTKNN